MATHWVCKADGTIQCQENPEIPLDVMRAQLAAVIGDKEILRAEKRSHIVIRLCGFPTGRVNAYELTEHGYWLLTHGFIGPMGFALCDFPAAAAAASDSRSAERDDVSTLVEALRSARLTSVGSTPILVRDLIGRPLRVYKAGDALTMDLIPERVNIRVDDSRRIAEIWYG
jgi:hypothetical protein